MVRQVCADALKAEEGAEQECSACGALLTAPNKPHTRRQCETCGKTQFRPPGAEGLEVQAGDSVVIPEGFLTMSLDPTKASGRFFRQGIGWFVGRQLLEDAANDEAGLDDALEAYADFGLERLKESDLLADVDLETDDGLEAAVSRVENGDPPLEAWCMRLLMNTVACKHAISDGEAAQAARYMQRAAIARSMVIFIEQLEELVWRGYRTFGVEELEAAIKLWDASDKEAPESYWQRLFAEHNFILSQLFSAPAIVIEDQPYVGGKEVSNQGGSLADFLLQNSLVQSLSLVEIKKPAAALLAKTEYRQGVYAPSEELAGAIAQAQSQRDTLLKEYYVLTKGKADAFPYDPLSIVIVGDTSELDTDKKRQSFELFRRGLKDIQIVTFDEVFGQAEKLLGLIRRYPAQTPPADEAAADN